MKVSVPAEVKNNENRVAITPADVTELTSHGHDVFVQSGAGEGSAISDEAYEEAGATIVPDAAEAWGAADLVLKVKEPVAEEYEFLRGDLTLFTYLHLAADKPLTDRLLSAGTTAIAYETVQTADRRLPLLAPMSAIAGRLAPQVGASALLSAAGGPGILLSGVPGVARAKVTVIGGGAAGINAARIAVGLGASVEIIDISAERLEFIDSVYGDRIQTTVSNSFEIARALADSDLVVGSVLIPGKAAPKLVTDDMVRGMKKGSVLVDIAIDQGGCFENSKPTTHADPTFTKHNSIFYCVTNMPGAVASTSTRALTNATLPYVTKIADRGWESALRQDAALAKGLNTTDGKLTNEGVAEAFGYDFAEPQAVLQD